MKWYNHVTWLILIVNVLNSVWEGNWRRGSTSSVRLSFCCSLCPSVWYTQHPLKASAKVTSFSVHREQIVNHLRPWHRLHHAESFLSVQRIHFKFLHRLQNTDSLKMPSILTSEFRVVAPCRVLHKRMVHLFQSSVQITQTEPVANV